MGNLGQLLAKCAGCGALYPTGIITDLEMVERNLDDSQDVKTRCPFCRKENLGRLKEMAFTTEIFAV